METCNLHPWKSRVMTICAVFQPFEKENSLDRGKNKISQNSSPIDHIVNLELLVVCFESRTAYSK